MRIFTTSIIATGLLTIQVYPHLFPNNDRSGNGTQIQVKQETIESLKNICKKLGISKDHKIKVYVDKSFTAGNLGNTWLPNGAIISLPFTTYFATIKDVENSNITFANQKIERKDLLQRFITSSNCNNFQLAHELAHLKSNDFIPRSIIIPAFYVIAISGFRGCDKMFIGLKLLKGLSKAIITIATLGSILLTNAYVIYKQEYKADQTAACIDPTYLSGGIELMHKYLDWDNNFTDKNSTKSYLMIMYNRLLHPPVKDRLQRLLDLQEQNITVNKKN